MTTVGTGETTRPLRAVVAASIGTMIEGYDLLLYSYFATILAEQFFPQTDPTAALLNTFAIFALAFAVRPIGGVLFGHLGDRIGRRNALSASILLMAVATLAIGVLPTYGSVGLLAPALLLICRMLQGLSIAGESVGANIFILEHARTGQVGRAVSVNQVAGYLGIAAAAATGLLLARVLNPADLAEWGWRLPFFAAVPLALVGLYLRTRVPESLPAAVAAARDTDAPTEGAPEAEAAPARPAAASLGEPGDGTRRPLPLAEAMRTTKRAMLIFSGWVVMLTVAGFLLFGYLPTYLTRVVGMDRTGAFGANLAAVATLAVGAVIGGFLVDRYPPRLVAIVCAAAIAVTVVPGFLLIQRGTVLAAVLGQVVWAAPVGVSATVTALLSLMLFPVHVRFTASAIAYNVVVTLFGGTAPYVSTWLIARTHNPISPAWYLVAVAVVGMATALFGLRSTRSHRRVLLSPRIRPRNAAGM